MTEAPRFVPEWLDRRGFEKKFYDTPACHTELSDDRSALTHENTFQPSHGYFRDAQMTWRSFAWQCTPPVLHGYQPASMEPLQREHLRWRSMYLTRWGWFFAAAPISWLQPSFSCGQHNQVTVPFFQQIAALVPHWPIALLPFSLAYLGYRTSSTRNLWRAVTVDRRAVTVDLQAACFSEGTRFVKFTCICTKKRRKRIRGHMAQPRDDNRRQLGLGESGNVTTERTLSAEAQKAGGIPIQTNPTPKGLPSQRTQMHQMDPPSFRSQ